MEVQLRLPSIFGRGWGVWSLASYMCILQRWEWTKSWYMVEQNINTWWVKWWYNMDGMDFSLLDGGLNCWLMPSLPDNLSFLPYFLAIDLVNECPWLARPWLARPLDLIHYWIHYWNWLVTGFPLNECPSISLGRRSYLSNHMGRNNYWAVLVSL
jgi:hypothetical protein